MGANSHAWEASLNLRWWVGKKDDLPVTTLGKYGALSLLPRKARPIHLFYTILETQVSIRVGTVRASGARRAGLPSGGALLSRAQTGAPPSLAVQGSLGAMVPSGRVRRGLRSRPVEESLRRASGL